MDDSGSILFLALAGGVGVALFFAAREFIRGVNEVRRDRDNPEHSQAGPDDRGQPKGEENPGSENPYPKHWHEVLEISSSASIDQIKVAYRRLIAQYHPDRVNDLGIELRVIAERRAKEINQAYETVKRLKRFV